MLEAVGNPVAVNPSWRLARAARKHGWHVYKWNELRRDGTQGTQRHVRAPKRGAARSREDANAIIRASRIARDAVQRHD